MRRGGYLTHSRSYISALIRAMISRLDDVLQAASSSPPLTDSRSATAPLRRLPRPSRRRRDRPPRWAGAGRRPPARSVSRTDRPQQRAALARQRGHGWHLAFRAARLASGFWRAASASHRRRQSSNAAPACLPYPRAPIHKEGSSATPRSPLHRDSRPTSKDASPPRRRSAAAVHPSARRARSAWGGVPVASGASYFLSPRPGSGASRASR
mmetsp:Transcript_18315/g.53412  ORF Transcript_18315/g.53412 Transcript_18315/m.53412 type:complete len:211 (-) Transcript_18315:954-1586(-)